MSSLTSAPLPASTGLTTFPTSSTLCFQRTLSTTACADFAKQNVPSCTTTFRRLPWLQRQLRTSVWSKGCTAACAGPNSSTGNGYISGVVSGSMLDRGAAYCSCGEVGEPGSARKANVKALAAIVGDKFTLATVDGELNYLKNLAKDQGYRFGSVRSIMAVWIAGCSVLMLM
ncbi:hypothetical protein BC829DRAFT_401217 [Chytridium lagenaria]|nr:hypothetical protein BC829DRAFT_401217 [Chytridium lagenaria]